MDGEVEYYVSSWYRVCSKGISFYCVLVNIQRNLPGNENDNKANENKDRIVIIVIEMMTVLMMIIMVILVNKYKQV